VALRPYFLSLEDASLRARWVQLSQVYWGIEKRQVAAGEKLEAYTVLVGELKLPTPAVEEGASSSSDGEVEVEKLKEEAANEQDAQKDELADDDDIEIIESATTGTGRSKTKRRRGRPSYLPYDASKHTLWAKPVSRKISLAIFFRLTQVHSVFAASTIRKPVSVQRTSATGCWRILGSATSASSHTRSAMGVRSIRSCQPRRLRPRSASRVRNLVLSSFACSLLAGLSRWVTSRLWTSTNVPRRPSGFLVRSVRLPLLANARRWLLRPRIPLPLRSSRGRRLRSYVGSHPWFLVLRRSNLSTTWFRTPSRGWCLRARLVLLLPRRIRF